MLARSCIKRANSQTANPYRTLELYRMITRKFSHSKYASPFGPSGITCSGHLAKHSMTCTQKLSLNAAGVKESASLEVIVTTPQFHHR